MFVAAHNGARIWGGAERATTRLLAGLQGRGHRVILYCNRPLVAEILRLRTELAHLLGYAGYPDYVLEDRMARDEARALAFTGEMTERAHPYWLRDAARLQEHARRLGLDELRPWDVSFTSEELRRAQYELDDEALRPWFPLDRVEAGLWELARRVFGLQVEERPVDDVWHADVRHYDIRADDGVLLGSFYTDWFPRKEKRQGAWMNDFRAGGPRADGGFDPSLGVICGNFTPPEGDHPALLTHREVETLFHEFGHILHQVLTRAETVRFSGTNTERDFVEAPSQIMEHWTWRPEVLATFVYFGDPEDVIPDAIPAIGYLDDIIMVELLLRDLKHVREAYVDFRRYRREYDRKHGKRRDAATRKQRLETKRRSLHGRMKRRQARDKLPALW